MMFEKSENQPLYIQLYEYYKRRIINGEIKSGTRLPSIRKCAAELEMSKTTVETAYFQLAAEGYVTPKANSGFYISDLSSFTQSIASADRKAAFADLSNSNNGKTNEIKYDFASSSVDRESFDFALWRRYMKSALRDDERLLSYGEPQGEYDLREAICEYAAKSRDTVCTPEQVVIGSGVQSLLYILCAAMGERGSNAAFSGFYFEKGETVFRDMGYNVFTYPGRADVSEFSRDNISVVYVSPSGFNERGEVLPVHDRLKLIEYAGENDALIVEDDYDSEFRYYGRPVPSLQGLDAGRNVVYLGTFSKLLIPSLRVSFMILPTSIMPKYEKIKSSYSQTASKAEQIALGRFIRDGHLSSQIRKVRKLYMNKSRKLCGDAERIFGEKAKCEVSEGGFLIRLDVKSDRNCEELKTMAAENGVALRAVTESGERNVKSAVLSCSPMPSEMFEEALKKLYDAWFGK